MAMYAKVRRLTHHCHIVETGNESYRFRHSSQTAASVAESLIMRASYWVTLSINR